METEIVDVALLVAGALETLDVPSFVGGSVASTAYGMIRTTQDIDLATPTTLYADTFDDGIFKSVDAGTSWIAINNGLAYSP